MEEHDCKISRVGLEMKTLASEFHLGFPAEVEDESDRKKWGIWRRRLSGKIKNWVGF